MSFIKFIVGLGNPGSEYKDTRHNVGFKVVDVLCEENKSSWQAKKGYEICEVQIAGERVKIIKPQTYMNNSGGPVSEVAGFFKYSPSEVLVIHDELDLPFGVLRLKAGGGDAGNNGLRSITASLGSSDYNRLRIGIGKPENPEMEGADWVLSKFNSEEKKALPELLKKAAEAALDLAEQGLKAAQNKFNR